MSTVVKAISNETALHSAIFGGWKPYLTTVGKEELEIFQKAIGDLIGVNFTPIAVATQLVSGTNYSFFCNSKVVGSDFNQAATVLVYVNSSGDVKLQSITQVSR